MMTTHFSILPQGVLESLSLQLDSGLPFLRLPHPRTGIPSLFLPYDTPQSGSVVLEVQAVEPPNQRSWFVGEEVVADGTLLVMTPVDPAFLLIPLLQAAQPKDSTSGNFLPADDLFDAAVATLSHASDPTSVDHIRKLVALPCVTPALRRVCDVKEITAEITVYRISSTKLIELLRAKVARLEASETLASSRTVVRALARDGLMEDGKEALLALGRTKAACDLVGQYVSPEIQAQLLASYDFTALEAYLKAAADESAATLAASTNTNMKSAGKKKAKEEGKDRNEGKGKRKAGASVGVEKLKRANTSGMQKLSSFFVKTN